MEFEEIIRLVNQVALERKGRPLKDVERLVLRGAWDNQTYGVMADQAIGYSEDYLKKDVGPKLWRFLSDLVDTHQQGLKVTKRNIQNVLREWAHQNQSSLMDVSDDSDLSFSTSTEAQPEKSEFASQCRVRELPLGDGVNFCGRSEAVATLTEWLTDESANSCRLIVLWGLAGVGKTALVTQVIHRLNRSVEQWGYLELPEQLNQVEVLTALANWLDSSPGRSPLQLPSLDWIMAQLSQRQCWLVLDRLETLFTPNQLAGTFGPHTELIQQLFLRLADSPHQSCVVALSREKPVDLPQWLGSRVREYHLKDLELDEVEGFLQQQGVGPVTSADLSLLVERYGSSPLLLRNLATTLKEIYQGQVKPFLEQPKLTLPAPIRLSLTATLNRLSPEEQGLLYWLALAHDSVALDSLDQITESTPGSTLGQSLLGRSLCTTKWVEGGLDPVPTHLEVLPLVRSLALEQLLEILWDELISDHWHWLHRLPLVTMTAREVVQDQQRKAVLHPLGDRLRQQFPGQAQLAQKCHQTHQSLRTLSANQPGYGIGNFLHLCHYLGLPVSGLDFSNLAIWQADLRPISLQGANFSQAQFRDTCFATALGRNPVAAFSPDGQFMATGDHEGRLLLWEINLGRLVQVLHDGESQAIYGIAFSPNGDTLAVGTDSGQIWLWPVGGSLRADLLWDHQAPVRVLSFSPDGRWLASGDDDGRLCLWDIASGLCEKQWLEHQGAIHSLAFDPGGDRLISSAEDQRTCLWHVSERSLIASFQASPTASIRTAGFLPDPTAAQRSTLPYAAGYDDQCLTLWEVNSGRPCWILPVDAEALPALVISPNGEYLAASRQDCSVTVWDIPSRRPRYHLPPLDSPVWTLVFSSDSTHLVTGSDYRLRLWNAQTGHGLRSFISQAHPISCLAFTAVGQQLLTGHTDAQLRLWPLQTQTSTRPTTAPQTLMGHSQAIQALAVSANGQWIASAAADQTVGLWHPDASRCIHILNTAANLLSFSPDSQWLASSGNAPQITLWEVTTGLPTDHWMNPIGVSSALLFSPDQQWLVSGHRDGRIAVWPFPQGSEPRVLAGHRRQVHSLAVNPLGILASASHDGTVRWWDLATGQSLGTWQHPNGHWVHQVINDPGGEFVAITSLSLEVEVWAVQCNQLRYPLRGHSHDIWGVTASPDGQCLATASQDYEIRVWSLRQGNCLQVLHPDRPYEGVNLRGAKGLSSAETAMLKSLGAVVGYSP